MTMSLWPLIILVSRLHDVYAINDIDVWKPVIVSNATLYNSTIQRMQVNVSCDIACSIFASRQPWADLFCFLGVACHISSFLAVPYPSETPIDDPVDCMTKIDGCLFNGLRFALGDYYALPDNPDVYHCVNGVMEHIFNPPPRAYCPSPFTNTSYGCLRLNTTTAPWNEARLHCLSLGSDLATFENVNDNGVALMQAVFGMGYTSNLHVGMVGNLTYNQWVTGKPINTTSPIWWPGYPSRSFNPACGFVANYNYWFYGLADSTCSRVDAFMCEIKIIN